MADQTPPAKPTVHVPAINLIDATPRIAADEEELTTLNRKLLFPSPTPARRRHPRPRAASAPATLNLTAQPPTSNKPAAANSSAKRGPPRPSTPVTSVPSPWQGLSASILENLPPRGAVSAADSCTKKRSVRRRSKSTSERRRSVAGGSDSEQLWQGEWKGVVPARAQTPRADADVFGSEDMLEEPGHEAT
ncbi:hypothetical protein CONLIGDRAFT_694150 [Coniochaeta ligniaria NRRL 30616]|uniref:Uncharacterized protein n=1 Tax=Coniochaeta ligniaria NRRL 30616 TaxID=1408157 RepID=A0A1J7I6N7_9PEZI|nr:hypothetical protein CONLIGDRAFT_694150 [Coniochaeta ligniaria NRRL 30616]